MITYTEEPKWTVKLDGKKIGEIRRLENGFYQYWPKGQKKHAGTAHVSLEQVKRELES